jgi:glycine cleavage system H protein
MSKLPITKSEPYYTTDHEWINFQGSVAYIGVCKFKLTGFKQIHELKFNEPSGFKKQGEILATVKYHDYLVEIHMPVDGKVMQLNEELISGNPGSLLDFSESSAWIALIVPSQPHERKGLLMPVQYQLNGKSKYAKY